MTVKKLLLPVAVLTGMVLGACGGGNSTPPDVTPSEAANLYLQNCAPCHGTERQGVVGPSLKAADLQARGRTDDYIRQTITNGRGGMPAWKDKLSSAQIEALIKFLRQ